MAKELYSRKPKNAILVAGEMDINTVKETTTMPTVNSIKEIGKPRELMGRNNDQKEGYGEFYYEDGKRYVGHFKANNMDGNGTLSFKNNTQYTGHFKDGKRQGKGIFKDQNGTYFDEVWDNGAVILHLQLKGTMHLDVNWRLYSGT